MEFDHMKETTEEYRAIYKCRLCGEVYESGCAGGRKIAMQAAISSCLCFQSFPQQPSMNEVHYCKNGDFGVADFQGFRGVNLGGEIV